MLKSWFPVGNSKRGDWIMRVNPFVVTNLFMTSYLNGLLGGRC